MSLDTIPLTLGHKMNIFISQKYFSLSFLVLQETHRFSHFCQIELTLPKYLTVVIAIISQLYAVKI